MSITVKLIICRLDRRIFMKRAYVASAALILLLSSWLSGAQQTLSTNTNIAVPPLVNFSGALTDINGKPITGIVGVTFLLYKDQRGGSPLWMETQNVQPDTRGHYTVMLGSTSSTGLPSDIFVAGEAHWLAVQIGDQAEQPRVLLVSAPYALKAGDAETIGGLPPSAFVLAAPQMGRAATEPAVKARAISGPSPAVTGTGTTDYIPLWTNSTGTLGNSNIFQSSANKVGIGTTTPAAALEVNGTAKVDGAATFASTASVTGNLTVNADINLAATTSSGVINIVGVPFLSAPGIVAENTSLGLDALSATTKGIGDTATGVYAMSHDTSGSYNTANGTSALLGNSTGSSNVAVGYRALAGNTTGSYNVALGNSALSASTSGLANTGIGNSAGNTADGSKLTGKNDAALGTGTKFGTGSLTNATAIGANAEVTESNAMVLGSIKGVNGQTVSANVGIGTTAPSYPLDVQNPYIAVHGAGGGASETSSDFLPDAAVAGVWGDSGTSFGVLGTADDSNAGFFSNSSGPHSGSDGTTIYADNYGNPGSPVFEATGPGVDDCTIDNVGNLSCTGTVTDVVPSAGGARRVSVYAMQSADNWFEDAGSGQLANGSAVVAMDPTFAQIVNTGVEYHVFLTPNGDCRGLFVTHKSAASFEVHELGGGASSIAFDYRIMAKRMGYEKERLKDVTEQYQKMEQQQQLRRERMKLHRAARSAAGPRPPLQAVAQPASTQPE
jgi:hypothetical protein